MPDLEVRIVGLRELGTALRQVDRESAKALRTGFRSLAERIARAAASRVPGAAGTFIRARATQRGAGIAFPEGGDRSPGAFYPWLDFGGSVGKGHRPGVGWSGSVRREFVKGGRYIYPTIADHRADIEDEAGAAMMEAARKAGFDTQ